MLESRLWEVDGGVCGRDRELAEMFLWILLIRSPKSRVKSHISVQLLQIQDVGVGVGRANDLAPIVALRRSCARSPERTR